MHQKSYARLIQSSSASEFIVPYLDGLKHMV